MAVKVACVGNMNNNFFTLARFLRDRGIEADLFLRNNEFSHFLPEADSYTLSYQHETIKLNWGHLLTYYTCEKKRILSDLADYDFVIGCGTVPAFMDKINRQLDLFVPYGSDLYGFPFYRFPYYLPIFYAFSHAQRRGIRDSKSLLMEKSSHLYEDPLETLDYRGNRISAGLPVVYTPEYNPDTISQWYDQCQWYPEFNKIRQTHDLVVFHQTRLQWKSSPDQATWKGNDKLIRGFAAFWKRNHRVVRSALILIEYGADIQATRDLIRELGIEKNVFWFPKMMRKEIMVGLSLADIGTAEFHNSWICSGVIYESLAMAKPLLQYRNDGLDIYQKNYQKLYPIINVLSAQDITLALEDYIARPEYYKKIGRDGFEWHQENVIDRPLRKIVSEISS